MRLAYKDAVPFEIKTAKKSLEIPLTNEIADDFNHYYTYIVNFNSNNDFNKDIYIEDLSKRYKAIALKIEEQIRMSGDKKAKHTQYEMEFILACSYKLIEIFHLTQADLANVFGLKPNAFSKLGVYPIRSYDAYNKLQSGYLSMRPAEFGRPEAVDIADYLNKHIQAPYACASTILVTNEMDVIANVATTDAKDYLLTRPSDTMRDTFAIDSHYAYTRIAFALAYFMVDDEGNRVTLGRLVKKIKQILDGQEESVSLNALRQLKVLWYGKNLIEYVRDAGVGTYEDSLILFKKKLEEYKYNYEAIEKANFYLEQNTPIFGVIYEDEHFGAYSDDMNYEKSLKKKEQEIDNKVPQFETEQEVIEYHLECSTNIVNNLEDELLPMIDGKKYFKQNAEEYYSYIRSIKWYIDDGFMLSSISSEDKLRVTSCYYLSEVFKDTEVNEESISEVRKYLDTGKLNIFLDAIDKDSSGVHTQVIADEQGLLTAFDSINYFIDSEGKIKDKKRRLYLLSKKGNETTFLYIDLEAYNLTQEELDAILEKYRVIMVIHGMNEFAGVSLLNKELQLYSNTKECNDVE